MSTENNTNTPTHVVYQIIDHDDQARWNRIGAAWENKDGKGLTMTFDSYPTHGRIVVRERKGDGDQK